MGQVTDNPPQCYDCSSEVAACGSTSMEMHQVRYFLAVADELNFTRAAEKCNVSQPSLSRAIQLLEGEFGGQLFRREYSHTHLSELGKMVRPYLETVYNAAVRAKQLSRDVSKLKRIPFKLGIISTIPPNRLVHLIAALHAPYEGLEMTVYDPSAVKLKQR